MIEIAYGVDDDGEPWRRVTDRSLGRSAATYEHIAWDDVHGEWEPWNRDPTV